LGLAEKEPTQRLSKRRIWNVDVSLGSQEEILNTVLEVLVHKRTGLTVTCVNPHSQVVASGDKSFNEALNGFNITLGDGVGTIMAAKLLGVESINRFTRPDFFCNIESANQLVQK